MFYTAIAMGFVGSLHCIGMCGPLVLAMPYGRFSKAKRIVARSLYQSGRLFTYAMLGLILGVLGMSANLFGGQQHLSIGLGILLILTIIIPHLFRRFNSNPVYLSLNKWVKTSLSKSINFDSYPAFFISGMLNGLLPCGLVWLALSSALALGNGIQSSLFMLFFGLGTLPAMIGILSTNQLLKLKFNFSSSRLSNIVALSIAILLIVRGLNMGNYFSPYIDFDHAKEKIITICGFDH